MTHEEQMLKVLHRIEDKLEKLYLQGEVRRVVEEALGNMIRGTPPGQSAPPAYDSPGARLQKEAMEREREGSHRGD